MLALVTKNPIFVISSDEAMRLAAALKNLAQFYNMTPNPQVMAWIQLFAVAAAIYGPKLMLVAAQQRAQRAAAANPIKAAGGQTVPTPAPQPVPNGTPTGTMNWSGANPAPIAAGPAPAGTMRYQ